GSRASGDREVFGERADVALRRAAGGRVPRSLGRAEASVSLPTAFRRGLLLPAGWQLCPQSVPERPAQVRQRHFAFRQPLSPHSPVPQGAQRGGLRGGGRNAGVVGGRRNGGKNRDPRGCRPNAVHPPSQQLGNLLPPPLLLCFQGPPWGAGSA